MKNARKVYESHTHDCWVLDYHPQLPVLSHLEFYSAGYAQLLNRLKKLAWTHVR
jgi:hypothetical protein